MTKLDNKKDNQKKPLKLSTSGRLQIRKNLGPTGENSKNVGNKKTIQIVFRNKNNQQKSTSTAQSNFRGSSSFRTQPSAKFTPNPNFFTKPNKNFSSKKKKTLETKKKSNKKIYIKTSR